MWQILQEAAQLDQEHVFRQTRFSYILWLLVQYGIRESHCSSVREKERSVSGVIPAMLAEGTAGDAPAEEGAAIPAEASFFTAHVLFA